MYGTSGIKTIFDSLAEMWVLMILISVERKMATLLMEVSTFELLSLEPCPRTYPKLMIAMQ